MSARSTCCRVAIMGFAISFYAGTVCLPAALGQQPGPRSRTYEVDMDASRVYIKVGTATRLGHEHGVEGRLQSGKIVLGGAGELVFDMASFAADTAESRKRVGLAGKKVSQNEGKKVTETMRGGDVLDVARHPTARYRIASITPLDKQASGEPGTYQVAGQLALHGAEQNLSFKAKIERSGNEGQLRMTGAFTIQQTDYGMVPYSAAGGLAKVANELEITGDLTLRPVSSK